MRCEECHREMRARETTTARPYVYDLSGLPDVHLVGITVFNCARCKAEYPVIPRISELHGVIALALVHKPLPLRGEEIRYLRKWAGFPAQKFAALIGVTPEHLSRIENGHTTALGSASDRLARAVAVIGRDGEEARQILLKVADRLTEATAAAEARGVFRLERNRWKAAA